MKTNPLMLTLAVTSTLIFSGCAAQADYQLRAASVAIKEMQLLDIQAPTRNAGISASLHGKYGNKVLQGYLNSRYNSKSGREITQKGSN
jgi:hypothetical protein